MKQFYKVRVVVDHKDGSCVVQTKDYGWLYIKGPDGQWVTHRKLTKLEVEEAHDQASDMAVKQGMKVRAG